MFEQLREALRGFGREVGSDNRRSAMASMKEALVHGRLALSDLQDGIAITDKRLDDERQELATVERRRGLAAQVDDADTVAVADRFVAQHTERVRVLEQKRAAQEAELALAEREYEQMKRELKRAMAGLPLGGDSHEAAAMREVEEAMGERQGSAERAELDAMARARARADKEADASERLAALKRQLGREP